MSESLLKDVEVLTFDVFGTVVDWHGSIVKAMKKRASESGSPELQAFTDKDWSGFANQWREGFWEALKHATAAGECSLNVDEVHRRILENMLSEERWSTLAAAWDGSTRDEVNMVWHQLDGWPDSSSGLAALKKDYVVATLMNGNLRMMIDLAKHANLPWDAILSAELFGALKPDPAVYRGALRHLSVPPERCGMVAAHIYDLRAAAQLGMRTVYVRRPTEDTPDIRDSIRVKNEGGEVDIVVDSLDELVGRLSR